MMLKTKPTVGHRIAMLAALAQAALLLFWGATASAQEGNRCKTFRCRVCPASASS